MVDQDARCSAASSSRRATTLASSRRWGRSARTRSCSTSRTPSPTPRRTPRAGSSARRSPTYGDEHRSDRARQRPRHRPAGGRPAGRRLRGARLRHGAEGRAPETLARADAVLGRSSASAASRRARSACSALIETARGLVHCEEIALAAPPRGADARSSGSATSRSTSASTSRPRASELLYGRSRVVVAARAAGLRPAARRPLPRPPERRGPGGRLLALAAARLPGPRRHLPGARRAPSSASYSELSDEEAERCRRVVEAFEEAEAAGSASIQVDGRFVDYPLYHRARHKLTLFEAAQRAGAGTPRDREPGRRRCRSTA